MKEIVLVTLVHNRKGLVSNALKSAVDQTLAKDHWTHLVIDNASADGADRVCQAFANKHDHTHFVRMDHNMHQMPAYNWALKWLKKNYPKIDIMVQLDSDDELKPNALEEVLKTFRAHPEIGQTYSDFDIINIKGRVKHASHPKAKQVPNQYTPQGQKVLRKMFVKSNPIGHLRALRVSALHDIGGFDESRRFATDFNMAGRMLLKYPVVKIPKSLYRWREHTTQVQAQHSPEQTKNWRDMQGYYKKLFKERGLI